MGLHTGEAHLAGDDYGGFEVNRAARIAAAGHGGQVILSETTTVLVADALPEGDHACATSGDTCSRTFHGRALEPARHRRAAERVPTASNLVRNGSATCQIGSRRFVGRDRDIADLVALVQDARLVTLTGPGGIGKTSLAIEAARVLAPRFQDGAWFVNFATIDDPEQVRAAIAHGIGIFDGPERPASSAVLSFLADKSMILILDNMEHLLVGGGRGRRGRPCLADHSRHRDQPRAAAHRRRARAAGRAVVRRRDRPLHRSGASGPAWLGPGEDVAVVAEICDLLDDLPLGIELAAARVSALPPTVIRDRLAARLPLPGSGPRDAPARQRTLEGAVAWSHDLLPADRQEMLHRLGVFEGGFDLEQVSAVVGPSDGGVDRPRRPARARGAEPDRRGTDPRGQGAIPHAADDPVLRPRPAGATTASRPTCVGATPRLTSPWRPG